MQDIKSMTSEKLKNYIVSLGEPPFKAKQIFKWLNRGVRTFEEMTDISKDLKAKLSENAYINTLEIEKKLVSEIDGTVKYLFKLIDGEHIESVVMKYKHGNSICISTQVGCKMGCSFCASTIGGFKRNLTAAEILDQVMFAQCDYGEKISNIVLMGIGEPLDNFNNVLDFIDNVNHSDGLNIGQRHISLSTCGIVDKIIELADKGLQITLSISLHAPNDTIRKKIMPINFKWGVDELINSCHYYIAKTGRRISFEYTLIDGVNNSLECAEELARKLKGMICHLNIISVNPVKERAYKALSEKKTNEFCELLKKKGINATVRRVLGADINASCGQLRRESSLSANEEAKK